MLSGQATTATMLAAKDDTIVFAANKLERYEYKALAKQR